MEECRYIGNYKIIGDKPIFDSRNSTLFRAKSREEGATDYQFAIKRYNIKNVGERECDIANQIRNNSEYSIVASEPMFYHKENDLEYSVSRYQNDGMFLSELINQKLPLEKQLEILEKLLESLQHLHEDVSIDEMYQGYIHTDLNPGNIFVESVNIEEEQVELGEVKFIDFSNALPILKYKKIAKKEEDSMLGGVPGFFPYDLIDMSRSEVYPSVDLYSVAAIAAKMYTGIETAERWDYEVEDYWRKKQKHSLVDYMYYRVLKCALDYNPSYRYKDAQGMLQSVKNISRIIEEMDSYFELFELAFDMVIPLEGCEFEQLEFDVQKFIEAKTKLELAVTRDIVEKNKCNYIFEALWKLCKNDKRKELPREIYCEFLSCGVTTNNSLANNHRAFEIIDELEKNKSRMSVMTKANVNNRIANTYIDLYEYERAGSIIRENISILELLKSLAGADYKSKQLARAYSLGGYCEAYVGGENVLDYFMKAMDEFSDGENAGNINITLAHLLNYTFVRRDEESKNLYYRYIDIYLQNETEGNQQAMNALERREYFVDKFAKEAINAFQINVYLKGVYNFELEGVKNHKEFIDTLRKIINEKPCVENEYPINLIYKYAALILEKCGRSRYVKDITLGKTKSLNSIDNGRIDSERLLNILMLSSYQTKWEYNEQIAMDTERDETERIAAREENAELFNRLKNHKGIHDWNALRSELDRREKDGSGLKELIRYGVI